MEQITESQFLGALESGTTEHENYDVTISNEQPIDLGTITQGNKFTNCHFKGHPLFFITNSLEDHHEPSHRLSFYNCTFETDVKVINAGLLDLTFNNCDFIKGDLYLSKVDCEHLEINATEDNNFENFNFLLSKVTIKRNLKVSYLRTKGRINISDSSFEFTHFRRCEIKGSSVVSDTEFNGELNFSKNNVEELDILHCKFNKADFSDTDFGLSSEFYECDFKGTSIFSKAKNDIRSELKFRKCKFSKYSYFNEATLYKLSIDVCKFEEFASFQDIKLNYLFLDRTLFEKQAFFDDLEIDSVKNIDKRTIRNVKQLLLRSDNSIDYNRFRTFELNSYRNHLKIRLKALELTKQNRKDYKRDRIILWINQFYSNNGMDWVKAMKHTLFLAVFTYTLFYIISCYQLEFHLRYYNHYFNGFFRFLLVSDFYDPLSSERIFLTSTFQWIPFLIGKILIAIGIYEMIISFRKFKK